MKPLQDYVLLKLHAKEEKLKSGLYVPGTSDTRFQKATVKDVGPGKSEFGEWIKVSVKTGDVVLFDSRAMVDLGEKDDDGSPLVMCPEGALLAKEQ
jgi:co-chaperonin GroES (HSP10)